MTATRRPPPTILYSCGHVLCGGKDARPRDPLGVIPLAEAPADAPYQFHDFRDWRSRPVRRLTTPRIDLTLDQDCPWCVKRATWG